MAGSESSDLEIEWRGLYITQTLQDPSVGSTASRIPPEIIAGIMKLLVDPPASCEEVVPYSNPWKTLVYPSHISSIWRQTILGMSSLHSHLDITYTSKTYGMCVAVVAAWVERAGGCAVSLYISDYGDTPGQEPLRDMVAPHAHRLKSIVVSQTSKPARFLGSYKLPRIPFPLLEELTLSMGSFGGKQAYGAPPRMSVSMGVAGFRAATFSQFPWSQLTRLELQVPMSLFLCMAIASRCARIVSCTFGNICLPPSTLPDMETPPWDPEWPHLKRLSIRTSLNVTRLFEFLYLPALEDFSLVFFGADARHPIHQSPLASLLKRSGGKLKKLKIEERSSVADRWADCLRQAPLLKSLDLRVYEHPEGDSLFRRLTFKDDVSGTTPDWPCLVPLLETLEIQSSDPQIENLIRSRWEVKMSPLVSQLQRVKLVHPEGFDHSYGEVMKERLAGLVEKGLLLEIESS